jgi:hypothetical protein
MYTFELDVSVEDFIKKIRYIVDSESQIIVTHTMNVFKCKVYLDPEVLFTIQINDKKYNNPREFMDYYNISYLIYGI